MQRGFKTRAEQISLAVRQKLNLSARDKFEPENFLKSLGVYVWVPSEIPGLNATHLSQLVDVDPDSWSGITIREGTATAIIINPTHPPSRQANTLMHEWAHMELRHKPNRVDRSEGGLLLLSDYPSEYEDEADWLAGTILLPRDGLLHCRSRGMTYEDIAAHFGVSVDLTNWRLRATGIERQLHARQRNFE